MKLSHGAPSYGAVEKLASGEVRVFEWEGRGYPWTLLLQAASLVGKQYVALAMIVFQVFYMSHSKEQYLMVCDERQVGLKLALVCEYTKAYVRCFPLLAMVISLVVAARLILYQRVYYTMLRCGVLCDFENFHALRDPLFRAMLWCISHAFFHFALDTWLKHNLSLNIVEDLRILQEPVLQSHLQKTLVFYFVPTMFALLFLYPSYDIESMLLPLSKYWEEDPRWARQSLNRMVFVDETEVAAIVMSGLNLSKDGMQGMQDACNEIVARCPNSDGFPDGVQAPSPHPSTSVEEGAAASISEDKWVQSPWRLVSRMWPAQLLLDDRLSDVGSTSFRRAWLCFGTLSLGLMLFVFFFFIRQVKKDIFDVVEGQYPDSGALAVEVAFASVTGWISVKFLGNLLAHKHKCFD